jgi:uncharacterized protein
MARYQPLLGNTSPSFRLLLLILIVIGSAFVSFFAGILLLMPFYGVGVLELISGPGASETADHQFFMRYVQVVNQIGVFAIPSFLFAFLVSYKVFEYLGLRRFPGLFSVISVVLLMYLLLPLIHETLRLNQMMSLPEALSGLEQWMRSTEIRAEEITHAFLKTESLRGLFINLMIVAVLASVAEELLFRSVLIRLFREWFGNVHVAVFVSALLFSAFHLQFFSFLPRFLLGIIFGYLFVWSGSVWLPMLAHFVNNASAVVVFYLVGQGAIEVPVEEFGAVENPALLWVSILLTAVLLVFIFMNEKSGIRFFKRGA